MNFYSWVLKLKNIKYTSDKIVLLSLFKRTCDTEFIFLNEEKSV